MNRARAIFTPAMAAFALLLAPQAAHAQDASFDWSGAYIGVNGGYAQGHGTVTEDDDVTLLVDRTIEFDTTGALGGVQAGYSWQFDPSLLFGWEADFDISKLHGEGSLISIGAISGQIMDYDADSTLDWFGTVRARAGFIAGNLLVYGTGGLAYGQYSNNAHLYGGTFPGGSPCTDDCYILSSSKLDIGWTLGAGVELAVSDKVSLRAEYQRLDFGDQNLTTPSVGFYDIDGHFKFDNAYDVVRLGVNVKF